MAVSFDTLAYAKRLRGAGLTDEQAAVHAEALAFALEEIVVTKQDLRELATREDFHRLVLELSATRQETASELAVVRGEMASEFAAVRHEMTTGFAAVRAEMASEFAAVRDEVQSGFHELRQEMRALEHRLLLRFGALFTVGFGALAALLKLA